MFKEIISKTANGFLAGLLIAIGGSVYLSCDNKYVGAVFFCVALLTICYFGFSLFTGKVGGMVEVHDKNAFSVLLLGLLGNAMATSLFGYLMRLTSTVGDKAYTICSAKLELSFGTALFKGIMCGILMYIAVQIFKDFNKNIIGILFCIPVFILSGFEHSIADMFYFGASGIVSFDAFLFLMIIVLGNAIGGMLIPFLKKLVNLK